MKRLYVVLLLCSGALIGFLCGTLTTTAYSNEQKIDYDRPVAMVGGTAITRGQLAEQAIQTCGKQLIKRDLQMQALVAEAARRANLTVSDAEVAQEVDNMMTFAHDAMAAQRYKEIPRTTWEAYARTTLLSEKMLNITISEQEARNFYMKNPSKFVQPPTAKLICIPTNSATRAGEVNKRLKDGEDPNALARLFSADPGLKESGGEMNWVVPATVGPDVAQKIFGDGLKPGQWTDIVKYEFVDRDKFNRGEVNPTTTLFAIFYVKDIRPGYAPKFEEVKQAATYAARMSKYLTLAPRWLNTLSVELGKDWRAVSNIFDPFSQLQPAPLPPDFYDREPVKAAPNS